MTAIGVTGHRVIVHLEPVSIGVDKALRKIRKSFPGEGLTIVSPLAEGADRLVVLRVMEMEDVHLIVPLPLEMNDYLSDFKAESSKMDFLHLLNRADKVVNLPPGQDRTASYLAAGLYVLENCDVLITVWDGQPAQGPGGTGQIVADARDRMMPIAWVYAGEQNPRSGSISRKNPGEVIYENFP